jgi:hypothetical protein
MPPDNSSMWCVASGGVVGRVFVRSVDVERDPAFIEGDEGTLIAEFDDDRAWSVGDRLSLPDGDEVRVLGFRELLIGMDSRTVLFVGEVSKP